MRGEVVPTIIPWTFIRSQVVDRGRENLDHHFIAFSYCLRDINGANLKKGNRNGQIWALCGFPIGLRTESGLSFPRSRGYIHTTSPFYLKDLRVVTSALAFLTASSTPSTVRSKNAGPAS